jgi:hypothetical protein
MGTRLAAQRTGTAVACGLAPVVATAPLEATTASALRARFSGALTLADRLSPPQEPVHAALRCQLCTHAKAMRPGKAQKDDRAGTFGSSLLPIVVQPPFKTDFNLKQSH